MFVVIKKDTEFLGSFNDNISGKNIYLKDL